MVQPTLLALPPKSGGRVERRRSSRRLRHGVDEENASERGNDKRSLWTVQNLSPPVYRQSWLFFIFRFRKVFDEPTGISRSHLNYLIFVFSSRYTLVYFFHVA